MNFQHNHFEQLYKYRETKDKSCLENYSTEAFVFILNYLMESSGKNEEYKDLCNNIFTLFSSSFDEVESITTQEQFEKNKKTFIPDIVFITNKGPILIEVKVNQQLNESRLHRGIKGYDQLTDYGELEISGSKPKVFSLTKNQVVSTNTNNIRWSKIYELIQNANEELKDFLLNNYLSFMENYEMGREKFEEIKFNDLNYLPTLFDDLELLIRKKGFRTMSRNMTYQPFTRECYGSFYENVDKGIYFWFGLSLENNQISFCFNTHSKDWTKEKISKKLKGYKLVDYENKKISDVIDLIKSTDRDYRNIGDYWVCLNKEHMTELKNADSEKQEKILTDFISSVITEFGL